MFAALVPQLEAVGGEAVVVSPREGRTHGVVRWFIEPTADLLRLRAVAIARSRGDIVAIGEDHAVPTADWCAAVLRAHADRPDAFAVAGCLRNATDNRMSARVNFAVFAHPYVRPLATLPPDRPPPSSVLSFKRDALAAAAGVSGSLETDVIPRLFADRLIAVDDRIVVSHYQDFGWIDTVRNSFCNARSSYGYARSNLNHDERRRVARWVLANLPRQLRASSALGSRRVAAPDLFAHASIAGVTALGAAYGSLRGAGAAPRRIV